MVSYLRMAFHSTLKTQLFQATGADSAEAVHGLVFDVFNFSE